MILFFFIKKHEFVMGNSNNSKKYKEDVKMTPNPTTIT